MNAFLATLIQLLILLPFFALYNITRDFGQCDRRCRLGYSKATTPADRIDDTSVAGYRSSLIHAFKASLFPGFFKDIGDETCTCWTDKQDFLGNVKRYNEPFEPGYPYLWRNTQVCGVDGKEYANADQAKAAGTKIINCGHCGTCSNVHDVALFKKFDKPMTKLLSYCAIAYLVAGEGIAKQCLDMQLGLTERCANRFIDNYGCNIAHCIKECLFKGWNPIATKQSNMNNSDELNPCLLCDEIYCSSVYLKTAGANRRCAGVQTDIRRPDSEICQHVNAV